MTGNGVQNPPRQDPHEEGARQRSPAADHSTDGFGPPHPLGDFTAKVREIIEYAKLYVETRKDMMRAAVRSLVWKAALGVVAGIAGATILIVATVYVMGGIAEGLGLLFGEHEWLGRLVTGLAVFVVVALGAYLGIRSLTKKSRERTIKKYERRQQHQSQRFGHNVTQRAQQLRQAHRS